MTTPQRTVITGGPRTGKTTLANDSPYTVFSLDTLIASHEWSEQSRIASEFFDLAGPWIIEGCAAVRALRKWLARTPSPARPCDRVIYLQVPHAERSKGQSTLAKGVHTVWLEILPELQVRGVDVTVM